MYSDQAVGSGQLAVGEEKDEEVRTKDSWNEESFASLLDFKDENHSNNQENQSEEINNQLSTNAVEVSELFDDPQQNKTQTKFYSNPLSKIGLVGLIMVGIFGTAATVVNSIVNHRSDIKIANNRLNKPKLEKKENIQKINETGKLKAQLALSSQAKKIKSLEDARKKPKKDSVENKQGAEKKPPPSRTSEKVAYTPRVERYTPRAPRYNSRVERYTPKIASAQRFQEVVKPKPKPLYKESALASDPMEEWSKINRLGSYGSVTIAIQKRTQNNHKNLNAATLYTSSKDVTIPRAQMVSVPVQSNDSELEPLHTEEAAIININRVRTRRNLPVSQVEFVKRLTVGAYAAGKFATPLIWSRNNDDSKSTQKQKFIIRLSESLTTTQGYVVIPKNSQIIANITDIVPGGLVQMEATQVVIAEKEYILPNGAIKILGKSGQALIASKRNTKRADIARRDIETFGAGSLAKVGRVLNQPSEEQLSTNSGIGGTNTFSSIRRNRSNVLGAILEGGFEPLTQQILQRNQRAIKKIQQQQEVWYLKSGTSVRVFVNQSFQF
ncbi:MAG: TrbI/VirB10 family protein [Mastigocoleus sp.]